MAFTFTPPRDDPDEGFFWKGLDAGELLLQLCTACDVWQSPPVPGCRSCGSPDHLEAAAASGEATVYSWTVCHLAFDEAFAQEVPFVVAEVELVEGPRMLVRVEGVDTDAIEPDMPVVVGVGERDGYPIPVARLRGDR